MPLKDKIKDYSRKAIGFNDMLKEVAEYKENILNLAIEKQITEKEFYQVTSLLTPQSRSPLWEKYFIKKIGAEKTPSSKGEGDFKYKNKNFEFKISGFNQGDKLNVVQVRIWQPCDYIIVAVSPYGDTTTFVLTHEDMVNEITRTKASSAHGTKASNLANENIEVRFTIEKDSEDYRRWIDSYSVTDKYFE